MYFRVLRRSEEINWWRHDASGTAEGFAECQLVTIITSNFKSKNFPLQKFIFKPNGFDDFSSLMALMTSEMQCECDIG
jgi:hypothetical protein